MNITTLLSERDIDILRNDDMLGSGNFLDRCLALSHTLAVDFIFTDKPITIAGERNIQQFSLNTLASIRRDLAGWYLANGIETGDVVAVCIEDGMGPFLHYLAVTSIGATIALINPAIPPDIGIPYIKENGFNKLVTDEFSFSHNALIKNLRNSGNIGEILNVVNFNTGIKYDLPAWWPSIPMDTTLLMLSHTSGTTGIPKAVKFEHRQFFMGKRARLGRFVESPDERLLTVLPQSHSAAISHLETAVLHGIPTYVLSSQDGEPVRQAIRDFSPTTVVAFPKSYVSLLERGVSYGEFPSIRRWFSMGDAAHHSHIRRLLMSSPDARYIDAFGSSELGMALLRSVSTLDQIAPPRAIGRPVDIVTAKILDVDSGDEMPAGSVGLLAVCSPTITSGYWKQSQKTSDAWRNGYFLTGDIGYCKDGVFYQIDRVVDVIHTPGGSLYTLQLEEAIQTIESIYDAIIIGLDLSHAKNIETKLVILILLNEKLTSDVNMIVEQVIQLMLEKIGRKYYIREYAIIVVNSFDQIPTGATGKVLKRRLKDILPKILEEYERNKQLPNGILKIVNSISVN
ncbi:class I adenylate-forming enzyme family protein [Photorhabdus temperata]|uniref:class I adenylate-forming enzyme family protein n=1 Tax=Photorhabdus temperata TaxID=574560 RepID=UPI000389DF22|nr:class I adenylate-forming enzyme family protein [Photorhabdus temperata]EQC01779.1 putative acyl-CoA synthetase [Photorhabdus temperata subsp. temperata M1021]